MGPVCELKFQQFCDDSSHLYGIGEAVVSVQKKPLKNKNRVSARNRVSAKETLKFYLTAMLRLLIIPIGPLTNQQ